MNAPEKKIIPLTEAEKKTPVAKFFREKMATPNPKAMAELMKGPMDPSKALYPDNLDPIYEPGYMEVETGYCQLPNGAGYCCINNVFPNCTMEMMQWWMAWHAFDQIRYRIWNPYCHHSIAIADCDEEYIKNPAVPLAKKSQNVVHYVIEDVGMGPEKLRIHFLDHDKMDGIDDKRLADAKMCVMGGFGISNALNAKKGELMKTPAIMLHFCRELEGGGVEFRTRFWMGYKWNKGKAMCVLPPGVKVPVEAPMGLAIHNVEEYSNLAEILPDVYNEFKDKPFDYGLTQL